MLERRVREGQALASQVGKYLVPRYAGMLVCWYVSCVLVGLDHWLEVLRFHTGKVLLYVSWLGT